MRLHCLPFQCSMSVPPPETAEPTAQASVDETAATPCRTPPLMGLGVTLHREPFQCSISACPTGALSTFPTAQTSFVDAAAIARRLTLSIPVIGYGSGRMHHCEPFQSSSNA